MTSKNEWFAKLIPSQVNESGILHESLLKVAKKQYICDCG